MCEENILYQIKSLDKLIIRNICNNKEDSFVKKKMTPTQMQIIEYILENKNSDIYQKDLENVLNLRRATVSGVLKTMEKNYLIERVIDSKDTRVKKIILHKDAQNTFLNKLDDIERLEKKLVKDISSEELEIFKRVIIKMKENILLEKKG